MSSFYWYRALNISVDRKSINPNATENVTVNNTINSKQKCDLAKFFRFKFLAESAFLNKIIQPIRGSENNIS